MADEHLPEDETEAERLFREDQNAVIEALALVMEERGLDEGELAALLVGELYHYRAIAYVMGTAKPSESGLRMDLDRLRKEIDELHREYRKNAGGIVRDILAAIEDMGADGEDGDGGENGAGGDGPGSVTPTGVLSDGSGR